MSTGRGIGSALMTSLVAFSPVFGATLNVHLPLQPTMGEIGDCPHAAALKANLALLQAFPRSEKIDFFKRNTPHLTLFLTEFDLETRHDLGNPKSTNVTKLDLFLNVTNSTVSGFPHCPIEYSSGFVVNGPYAMISISENSCLQALSDNLVLALQPFIKWPPRIPHWVYRLPAFKALQKIWLAIKYGSPNVFSQFDPHITVGYDEEASPEDRKIVLDHLEPAFSHLCTGYLSTVAVGEVGAIGSVRLDAVIDRMPLSTAPQLPRA